MRRPTDKYEIEPIGFQYKDFVQEIVYQAIFVAKDEMAPTREILNKPELEKYYKQWGRKGDVGYVVIHTASEQPIGGAFVRYYHTKEAGYGFVAESYPELNIALLPDHRSKGLGTRLLNQLLQSLKNQGCAGVSLSVDRRNPAFALYQRLGFKTVRAEENPTMLLLFS